MILFSELHCQLKIIIKDLPMCPSVNESLMPSRGRLVHTPKMRMWKTQIDIYKAQHRIRLDAAKEIVRRHLEEPYAALKVDTYHCFPVNKVWTKQGKAKPLDGNNRIKGALDAVAFLIGADDKYFFAGDSEKVTSDNDKLKTHLIITAYVPRTEQELFPS